MPLSPPPIIVSIVFAVLYLIQLIRLGSMAMRGNPNARIALNSWTIISFLPIVFVVLNVPMLPILMQFVLWIRENVIIVLTLMVILAEVLIRRSAKLGLAGLKTVGSASSDVDELFKSAQQLELRGNYLDAFNIHKRILEINPQFFKSYVNMAALAGIDGRIQEAETLARKALEIEPDDGSAHFYLAMALRDQGKITDSVNEFQTAIRLGLPAHLHKQAVYQSGKSDEKETTSNERDN